MNAPLSHEATAQRIVATTAEKSAAYEAARAYVCYEAEPPTQRQMALLMQDVNPLADIDKVPA